MLTQTLKTLFRKELEKLKREIELYQEETKLWIVKKAITNSGGNLCLHLIGNLNTYIGKELGHTGYIRNRDLEFYQKGVPRDELLKKIDETERIVEEVLDTITDQQLEEEYPVIVFAEKMTTGFFLIHLLAHLTYHLGQINYHRRLLDAW
ncbi:MAG: DinB family protein [Chitinophagaceae bacterium]